MEGIGTGDAFPVSLQQSTDPLGSVEDISQATSVRLLPLQRMLYVASDRLNLLLVVFLLVSLKRFCTTEGKTLIKEQII